jgi:hypothetical protein
VFHKQGTPGFWISIESGFVARLRATLNSLDLSLSGPLVAFDLETFRERSSCACTA